MHSIPASPNSHFKTVPFCNLAIATYATAISVLSIASQSLAAETNKCLGGRPDRASGCMLRSAAADEPITITFDQKFSKVSLAWK